MLVFILFEIHDLFTELAFYTLEAFGIEMLINGVFSQKLIAALLWT
jgi:hypothetical protein